MGWSTSEIAWACKIGDIVAVRPGVYCLPGLPPDVWRDLAAVLLVADDAVAAGFASAGLHRFERFDPGAMEIVVGRKTIPRLAGVRAHVDAHLSDAVIVSLDGLATLSAAETAVDLFGRIHPRRFDKLLDELERRERDAWLPAVTAAIDRRGPKHRPHLGPLLDLLSKRVPGQAGDCSRTAEVLGWLRDAGIEEPEQQVRIWWLGIENVMDLAWMPARLNLEVDDDWSHGTAAGARRDKARDARARRSGWEVERVTSSSTRADVVETVRFHLARQHAS